MPEREPLRCESMELYRLLKDSEPFLKRGQVYEFYLESALVYRHEPEDPGPSYSLRPGLAGWLWLLRTEPGWFRRVNHG